jgi:hypothetical protein
VARISQATLVEVVDVHDGDDQPRASGPSAAWLASTAGSVYRDTPHWAATSLIVLPSGSRPYLTSRLADATLGPRVAWIVQQPAAGNLKNVPHSSPGRSQLLPVCSVGPTSGAIR